MDPRLILIIGVVILIVVMLAYGRWHTGINFGVMHGLSAIGGFLLNRRTCRVAETFFIESAVLWFVFPTLDVIYEHKSVTDPTLRQAYLAAIIFFVAAIVLSHVGKED